MSNNSDTLKEIAKRIGTTSKVTGAEVLNKMADNKHQRADIKSPLAFTIMHSVADWEQAVYTQKLSKIDWSDIAMVDRGIVEYGEDFSTADHGKRADAMLDATKYIQLAEFEIEKAKKRGLMG